MFCFFITIHLLFYHILICIIYQLIRLHIYSFMYLFIYLCKFSFQHHTKYFLLLYIYLFIYSTHLYFVPATPPRRVNKHANSAVVAAQYYMHRVSKRILPRIGKHDNMQIHVILKKLNSRSLFHPRHGNLSFPHPFSALISGSKGKLVLLLALHKIP